MPRQEQLTLPTECKSLLVAQPNFTFGNLAKRSVITRIGRVLVFVRLMVSHRRFSVVAAPTAFLIARMPVQAWIEWTENSSVSGSWTTWYYSVPETLFAALFISALLRCLLSLVVLALVRYELERRPRRQTWSLQSIAVLSLILAAVTYLLACDQSAIAAATYLLMGILLLNSVASKQYLQDQIDLFALERFHQPDSAEQEMVRSSSVRQAVLLTFALITFPWFADLFVDVRASVAEHLQTLRQDLLHFLIPNLLALPKMTFNLLEGVGFWCLYAALLLRAFSLVFNLLLDSFLNVRKGRKFESVRQIFLLSVLVLLMIPAICPRPLIQTGAACVVLLTIGFHLSSNSRRLEAYLQQMRQQ